MKKTRRLKDLTMIFKNGILYISSYNYRTDNVPVIERDLPALYRFITEVIGVEDARKICDEVERKEAGE